ncbi:hypothetical protein DPMN_050406 [Dreissena polymorpha]|uniref:Sushi domain-containing protein n=1 Tax=Dreissena polymorpha TaxID=45954 RepID=A0A9D4HN13_DREPO|nr:hypothetical protein DPMN_050406 [Dreissena polymorpha]
MFDRNIIFIIFRTACPALNDTRIEASHWHLDTKTFSDSTALPHNTTVTLTCDVGYWLEPPSVRGSPKPSQTVNCGSDGNWTPTIHDCAPISMNILR